MKERTYKCSYKYCKHESGDIPPGSAVKVGKRHMHPDCATESETVANIRNYYYENVSNTVVMKNLVAVINNIIHKKGIEAEYLMFALRYAIENRISIKSPYGLHYLVDNSRIKSEWKKRQTAKMEVKALKAAEEKAAELEPMQNTFTYKPSQNMGFGGVLK